MVTLLFFAFIAGFVTVLSPCILPVLPLLLSAGVGAGRYRPLGIIIGLIISFCFFTLSLTVLVYATGISPNFLRYAAITSIVLFGLTMIFPKLGNWFASLTASIANIGTKVQEKSVLAGSGFLSGFIFGIALGLLWTPCAGPILATITTLVATHSLTLYSVFITLAYSIGAALPMFFIAYGSSKIINSMQILTQYSEKIRQIFGVLMILSALAIAFHADVLLQQFTLKYFPTFTIEDNALIKKELEKIHSHPTSKSSDIGLKAPDFVGINAWINTKPFSLKQLKGKVVLVDFWTYSCINCIRTLPYLKQWYQDYKDKGLVIVGIHTPEFEFEKNKNNVEDAVKRFNIQYPVAMDNDYKTWQNYDNHYWPAHYLIDQQTVIQMKHFGEGAYQETENAIRTLLGLAPSSQVTEKVPLKALTPEIYLGYERAQAYQQQIVLKKDQVFDYTSLGIIDNDHVGLSGKWLLQSEFIQSQSDDALITLNFIATHVYFVVQSQQPKVVTVLLNDKPLPANYYTSDMNEQGQIPIDKERMYAVIDLKNDYGRNKLTLKVPKGVSLYTFTFGA